MYSMADTTFGLPPGKLLGPSICLFCIFLIFVQGREKFRRKKNYFII